MGTSRFFDISTSSGCSTRHETHHEAHTLSSHTLPRMLSGPKVRSAAWSCRELEFRSGLADEGRGHLARVAHEAHREEAHQHREDDERDAELQRLHGRDACAAAPAGTIAARRER